MLLSPATVRMLRQLLPIVFEQNLDLYVDDILELRKLRKQLNNYMAKQRIKQKRKKENGSRSAKGRNSTRRPTRQN